MTTEPKIAALHGRLSSERARLVRIMAEAEVLPASGALAQLATLDGSIVAVEAVLEQTPATAETAAEALPDVTA